MRITRLGVAGLIWLGVDLFLGIFIALAVVPLVASSWPRHDSAFVLALLLPNGILLIVPGAIAAAAYYLIDKKMSARKEGAVTHPRRGG